MKHGIICPTAYLEKFATKSNFHLILPHLFEKFPQYKEFYKERAKQGDFVLIDNSVFELEESFDYKKMLEYAEEIRAREISAPEVLRDREASRRKKEDFLEYYIKSNSKVNVLAVAQGITLPEIVDSYFELLKISEISTLGLPFDIDDEIFDVSVGVKSLTLRRVLNRWHLVNCIEDRAVQYKINLKPTHLMGLSDAVELQRYKSYSWIRSNDSSSAFIHGFNYIDYTDKGLPCEKIPRKMNFGLNVELTEGQILCINNNINKILSWTQND